MIDIKILREHPEAVVSALKKRGLNAEQEVAAVLEADAARREAQAQYDQITSEIKVASDRIGAAYKSGQKSEAETLKAGVLSLKEKQTTLHNTMQENAGIIHELLFNLPNIPDEKVPAGQSEQDNEVFKAWPGELPEARGKGLPHWELTAAYGLVDFETGTKITGSGFPLYKGKGAKLQRSLISFFLDAAIDAGYTEVIPPHLVNEDSAMGTGQLPDKEGQMYHVTGDNLYLIPTAEVPVTNIYRDVILSASELPVALTAYTPCFRREAGSYGKDVRGLNRVHQFDKVEIVRIEHPESSEAALVAMITHVESLLNALELPYRILRLCGGDLGFASSITYDFEVWSAAQKRWLEVSSVSNFKTFQSNRMSLRLRDNDRKTQLAHTLNGSALALARIFASLLENHQDNTGIQIPAALQPYTGFSRID